MTARKLRLVDEAPRDITQLIRDDITARDWSAVHVAGDRRAPVWLPEGKRRGWLR